MNEYTISGRITKEGNFKITFKANSEDDALDQLEDELSDYDIDWWDSQTDVDKIVCVEPDPQEKLKDERQQQINAGQLDMFGDT